MKMIFFIQLKWNLMCSFPDLLNHSNGIILLNLHNTHKCTWTQQKQQQKHYNNSFLVVCHTFCSKRQFFSFFFDILYNFFFFRLSFSFKTHLHIHCADNVFEIVATRREKAKISKPFGLSNEIWKSLKNSKYKIYLWWALKFCATQMILFMI